MLFTSLCLIMATMFR